MTSAQKTKMSGGDGKTTKSDVDPALKGNRKLKQRLSVKIKTPPFAVNETYQTHTAEPPSLDGQLATHEFLTHGIPMEHAKSREDLMSALVENDVIPRRTWGTVMKRQDSVLPASMGEKLQRTERVEALAKEALGEEFAFRWLCEENSKFNGHRPIELMKFDAGARAVEIYLGQVMHGFSA